MTRRTMRAAARLSRRDWLSHAAAVLGGILILRRTVEQTNAAVKMSQRVVAYQDHPEGEKRCDRCIHFQPPSACNIVDGEVRPDGYCRFFGARSHA